MKRCVVFLFVLTAVALGVFADEATPLSFPTTDTAFDPEEGGSSSFQLCITPTDIPAIFAIYGGADLNYGAIGSTNTTTLTEYDENGVNVISLTNSNVINGSRARVLIKVVQYNTAHCKSSYTLTVNATPLYLDGDISKAHTASPVVVSGSLYPATLPFCLNVNGDSKNDFAINSHTVNGSEVAIAVSYLTGLPIPPVYEEGGETKELILGSFTYEWVNPSVFSGGTYTSLVTITCTSGS